MKDKYIEEKKKEFEDRYCSFEISERVSATEMKNIWNFLETALKEQRKNMIKEIEYFKAQNVETMEINNTVDGMVQRVMSERNKTIDEILKALKQ